MATVPTKTSGTSLIAWADLATANVTVGTGVDVSSKWAASFDIRIARESGTAFTAGWPNVRIEVLNNTTNGSWTPLPGAVYQPVVGASIANTTLNGAVSAGATSCVVTSATNIAAGDILFLGHSSAANYELVRVKSVSGTTVTFEEACIFAHANAAQVTDQAEMYNTGTVDLTTATKVRAVADNAGSGQSIAVQVLMNTFDSFA